MSDSNNIQSIIILGGGTAGWMTAAALAKVITTRNCSITLIESEEIGTVGVGEATIPQISIFNSVLGIDENDFIKATQGTFKLGIEFVNWKSIGSAYIHPFSTYGTDLHNVQFYHYWQKAFKLGLSPDISDYSLNIQACYHNKFTRPMDVPNSPLAKIAYAYHFDAGLYARYLRRYAEALGVRRVEGKVTQVNKNHDNGFIKSLLLTDGSVHAADFFMDCSGFRGLLIEGALHTGYENWSHYLPADSAIAIPCRRVEPLIPYTRATAHTAGWQWRIPLQHRTGNGHVYSSQFIDDKSALDTLVNHLDGEPLAEPRQLRFVTGKRRKVWNKNCVALGLASGFLEPLESTSIHLVQSVISKFLGLFPRKDSFTAEQEKFNKYMDDEYLGIRDFIILHYKATQRDDSAFWNHCRTMEIPESLQRKLELYRSSSRLYRDNNELFDESSWLAVMHGQGIVAEGYNPIVDAMPVEELENRLRGIRQVISKCLDVIPTQDAYIDKYCRAGQL
ncbi:tryptophan halogenase family protein [Cellvibrio japonicus]|uniref:Tryptophan halogenase n=1 Tax=Cellvibrio japonicus (strain Ueda107) TaxID=498211 RepID=B3PC67_CELJU|nr:tryptophan halogenase family protein [Cellvibrio japonicus]ACE83797.1 tryptophan halogenase [Cellvibrio japonicus Ueda107]QEI13209.1 tryptophan 7-halogenase [Cellvibrio japonicus]QEI16783.1 tryptophan 7-halogenase [Cellvibrio japonicus]QEI20361.1 tryptophan 7-halogenase [Cellvibrio japonicus]